MLKKWWGNLADTNYTWWWTEGIGNCSLSSNAVQWEKLSIISAQFLLGIYPRIHDLSLIMKKSWKIHVEGHPTGKCKTMKDWEMVPDQKEQMNNNSVQHIFLDRILDQQGKGVIVETVDKILMGSVDWTVGFYQWYPNQDGFYSRNEKTVLIWARQTLITRGNRATHQKKKSVSMWKKREKINELPCQKLNNLGERDVIVLTVLL